MKMFKVCRICLDNINIINYPSFKLITTANQFKKCPMKPTCSGQPERLSEKTVKTDATV
jgi:hypothetical protein